MAARRQRHAAVRRFHRERRRAIAPPTPRSSRTTGGKPAIGQAADYLLTAAEQAGRGWAHHEVISLCNQALELIADGDEPRRRRARLRRGVALQERYHAEFDFDRAISRSRRERCRRRSRRCARCCDLQACPRARG